jgi:hypothetical protein
MRVVFTGVELLRVVVTCIALTIVACVAAVVLYPHPVWLELSPDEPSGIRIHYYPPEGE